MPPAFKAMIGWLFGHDKALRSVMAVTHRYAAERGSIYIGTEHVLVGICASPTDAAARALAACGATEAVIRSRIERTFGPPVQDDAGGSRSLVPRVKKAIERAKNEATARGHAALTSEHLLLGLIADDETVATNLLLDLGVDLRRLGEAVVQEAGWSKAAEPA
jgi:ATP-dependent Clp protease ATP-binding subunit ClpC